MTIIRKNDETGEMMFNYKETISIKPNKKESKDKFVVIVLHKEGYFLVTKVFKRLSDAIKYGSKKCVELLQDISSKENVNTISVWLTNNHQFESLRGEWTMYIQKVD